MRAWPGDDTVAHLIFVDHHQTPTSNDVAAAVEHAARKGARAIRTSAMFPDAARIVLAEGFVVIDRLALLHIELDPFAATPAPSEKSGRSERHPHRLRPMRPWHLTPCSKIDRESFGLMWGNTPASLRDIRNATPFHRSRIVRFEGHLAGFAISGAAADTGYVQRLAIAPDHRRGGLARMLLEDSLAWMRRRSATRALVNTGVDNDAALSLYDSIGFNRLDQELTIAELKVA
jgi:ribosomal protein S18 acetylase RimI-like enzyme